MEELMNNYHLCLENINEMINQIQYYSNQQLKEVILEYSDRKYYVIRVKALDLLLDRNKQGIDVSGIGENEFTSNWKFLDEQLEKLQQMIKRYSFDEIDCSLRLKNAMRRSNYDNLLGIVDQPIRAFASIRNIAKPQLVELVELMIHFKLWDKSKREEIEQIEGSIELWQN